ncbi:MAG: carboxypeptidase regulatory-like domain-containing protein [Gemmatimonadales bacterium]
MTNYQTLTNSVVASLAVLFIVPLSLEAQTGTVAGTVRVLGPVAPPDLITVTKNQDVCGKVLSARALLVNDGALAFAVVSVEDLEGAIQPTERLLSNSGCQFDPPIVAAAVGDTLAIDNRDDVLHNTHLNLLRGKRSRAVGNWALSRKGVTVRAVRPLRRAGMIDVECDAHSWMHAKIVIFDHPYFSSTNRAGGYRIEEVPVGTHTVRIWHEVFGEMEQTVSIRAGATSLADFVFSTEAVGYGRGGMSQDASNGRYPRPDSRY